MDFGLKDKRVFITGATDGMGKALAKIFIEEGAHVIIHGRPAKEEILKKNCEELGNAEYVMADLSDNEQVEEVWKQVGNIDVLVNNAGVWPTAYVEEMQTEDFHRTLDINLIAPFILSRNAVNAWMAQNRKGKIINIVSQAAFHGSTSGHAHYAASKAGLGDIEKQQEYAQLFEQGYQWTKENLFNGEYFYHKVDLEKKEYVEHFECPDYWNEEKKQLKYQIGDGCEIDQMLGQWHANIIGLGEIFDKKQRQIALKSMMKYNFKTSMRDFANPWRIFALNDESGSIMCDYPKEENKPIIPIPYCEECMTGFEYSFAGLLISEGFIEEGLNVIRAVRNRYDGYKRNPWNEIECGSNYARPMASFALLPIFSGMQFDLANHHIGFAPIVSGKFKCLWSLGSGWGDFIKTDKEYTLVIHAGHLSLDKFSLEKGVSVSKIYIDGVNIPFTQGGEQLSFEQRTAYKELRFEVMA